MERQIVENIAGKISAFFQSREQEIISLSQVYGLEKMALEQQRAILSNLLIQQQLYQELALLDAAGQELIRLSRSGAGSTPCSARTRLIVDRPTSYPRLLKAPRIRV